jgi:alcohol dehydrogenase
MLPHVVRFNAQDQKIARAYSEMACAVHIAQPSEPAETASEALAGRLESLLDLAGLPRSLNTPEAGKALIPALASEAARQWTAQFNPRLVSLADFEQLYTQALNHR